MTLVAQLTRRALLGAAAAAGGAVVGDAGTPSPADAAPPAAEPRPGGAGSCRPALTAAPAGPDDPRYEDLIGRGHNARFAARPAAVHVAGSADQVVRIVQDAVRRRQRIAVRGGGHCFEGFVDDPEVDVLIDMSEMKAVYFDPARGAFAIEAGATLGQVYKTLFLGWGVTVPAGSCPSVGVGGHFAGGGYGSLSRRFGLVADHLHAVEVVVADRAGRARRVTATADPRDENHDLWWAHTGGGGGSFGVVTRYWLRSPEARGDDPRTLLPRPPIGVRICELTWQWDGMTPETFARIADNFGHWHAREDSRPGSPYAGMSASLALHHSEGGAITVSASVDGSLAGVDDLLDRYVQAITRDVGLPHADTRYPSPWLRTALYNASTFGAVEFKSKASLLRRPWSPRQVARIYEFLTTGGGERWSTAVYLGLFGGRINAMASGARAMPHRDANFVAIYESLWGDPAGRDDQLAYMRALYRDLHADTGGVPVPSDNNAGAYINYPDVDLAHSAWNTSGVPWHTLYFRDNYRRLQRAKARWDPGDVFRHALSVRLPV